MKRLINYISLGVVLTFSLNSCEVDKTDPLFDDPPAVRIDKTIQELKTLLTSQEQGYSGTYFPNNTQVGGINLHMKFTEDLRVMMTSDFKSTTDLTDSRYDVVTGTTAAELVFTTGTRHITDLVQDGAAGFNTFFGNNSFQYVGEENGVITLKDVRSDGMFVLSPSGFVDFETESVASVNATYTNRMAFTEVDCSTSTVFDNLIMQISNGTDNINYILNYDPNNIFFDAETVNAEGIPSRQGFGVAFTLIDGMSTIKISPALEVGENSFEDFIVNPSNDREFIASVNGQTAVIFSAPLVSSSGEDVNADLPTLGPNGYLYRVSLGNNSLTSPCFREQVIDQVSANLDTAFGPGAFVFTQFQFIFDFQSDNCDNFLFTQVTRISDGQTFNALYCFNRANISNNRLFQEYTGPFGTGNAPLLEGVYAPLIEFFNNPETTSQGMFYTNEGSFRSDTNSFTNISGAFTKLDNPSLRVYGLFFNN